MSVSPKTGEAPAQRRAIVRARTAVSFAAVILAGAAGGLLFGLLWVRGDFGPARVTPPAPAWPAVYRCGVTVQPEDLDRTACDCQAVSTR